MTNDSDSSSKFKALEENEFPAIDQEVPFDLYVSLPNSHKYIVYVLENETWDQHKADMLKNHVDPQLYQYLGDALKDSIIRPDAFDNLNSDVPDKSFKQKEDAPEEIKVFKSEVNDELKTIFKFFSDPDEGDSAKTLSSMESMTEKILSAVAPEVEDLRSTILENSKYLMVMADAAAITSISVLIAMSHGFDSRKIFRDLSTAIMLMDLPLGDLGEETVEKYYANRGLLSEDELRKICKHPQTAYDAATKKLKNLSEPVLQLILNHQENYNGTGYPRGLRNEQLPPNIRSLCLAVNIFEIMKRESLNGVEIDILQALEELRETTVEAHRRKHNQKLISQSIAFIQNPTQD